MSLNKLNESTLIPVGIAIAAIGLASVASAKFTVLETKVKEHERFIEDVEARRLRYLETVEKINESMGTVRERLTAIEVELKRIKR